MKHIIIGAGVAGITAAKTIKEMNRDAEVVVIGDRKSTRLNSSHT